MSWIAVAIGGGALISGGASIGGALLSKGKPMQVPAVPQIDIAAQQAKAIASNQQTFGQASQLIGGANEFNQQQLSKMLEMAIGPQKKQFLANIQSGLEGKLTSGETGILQRTAAERFPGGSQFGFGTELANTLGLSHQRMLEASNMLNSAQSWMTTRPIGVESMFITPKDRKSVV